MKATQVKRKATMRVADMLWQRIQRFHLAPGKCKESLSYLWARCERVLGGYVVDRRHRCMTAPWKIALYSMLINSDVESAWTCRLMLDSDTWSRSISVRCPTPLRAGRPAVSLRAVQA